MNETDFRTFENENVIIKKVLNLDQYYEVAVEDKVIDNLIHFHDTFDSSEEANKCFRKLVKKEKQK